MLQCVCGYLPGKPSSQRTFSFLLKGNESFYSKINWSSKRSKRERKVPERYSEFYLNKDLMFSPEENLVRSAKQKNAINRPVRPFKPSPDVGAPSPTPVKSSAPTTSSVPSKLPGQLLLSKPGGNVESNMQKLLQDDRIQLQKLMNEEKNRAFDDEIDLTIRSGQTAKLVAWMRFHSVYHSGKMHIRYLNRRSGPVILVICFIIIF